jgi:hypothetical protein
MAGRSVLMRRTNAVQACGVSSSFSPSGCLDRWMAIQDVGISTQSNREYQIRRFLRPAWGTHPLDSLSTEQIAQWETSLPTTTGICRRTARDLRGLLGTILGDAASTRPPLIPYNPALRPATRPPHR